MYSFTKGEQKIIIKLSNRTWNGAWHNFLRSVNGRSQVSASSCLFVEISSLLYFPCSLFLLPSSRHSPTVLVSFSFASSTIFLCHSHNSFMRKRQSCNKYIQ